MILTCLLYASSAISPIFQPPVLNPRDDMKITDEAFYDLLERVQLLEKRLEDSPVHKLPNREGESSAL